MRKNTFGHSEIGEFDSRRIGFEIQEYVFRLDITMENLFMMNVVECREYLIKNWTQLVLGESVVMLTTIVLQVATIHVFENKIGTTFVKKYFVTSNNVWMLEVLVCLLVWSFKGNVTEN